MADPGISTEVDESDLEDLEVLCRLVLAARRLGCRLQITEAPAHLRELIDVAGLACELLDVEPDRPLPPAPSGED